MGAWHARPWPLAASSWANRQTYYSVFMLLHVPWEFASCVCAWAFPRFGLSASAAVSHAGIGGGGQGAQDVAVVQPAQHPVVVGGARRGPGSILFPYANRP